MKKDSENQQNTTNKQPRSLLLGIFFIVFGVIGCFTSVTMTIASVLAFGIILIVGGVFTLIDSFPVESWKKSFIEIMISLLYIVSGTIMVIYPEPTAIWFTLFIALFFMVLGILRIIQAFKLKDDMKNWWLILLSALLNFALGVMIYIGWPETGRWVIGLFISIEFIIQGINIIQISKITKRESSTPTTEEDVVKAN